MAAKVVIDCDPGIDDASALLLALAPGNLDVKAITTVTGNLVASWCTKDAKKILAMINRKDIPLGEGPSKPLVRSHPEDPFFHGNDGLGDLELAELKNADWESVCPMVSVASDLICEMANKYPGELCMICLGPLTNLALAYIKDPELPKKIKQVACIAGSYGFSPVEALHATGGNPLSEWNVYVDPEAANIVFDANFNLTAIGMDIFCQPGIAVNAKYLAILRASESPAAKFVVGVLDWLRSRGHGDYCALIDALAVAYTIDPEIFTTRPVRIAVETKSDLSLGQIVVERRVKFAWTGLAQINACDTVDGERYLKLLVGSFTNYPPSK